MHEWALAEAVVAAARKAAEDKQLREVTDIKIRLGELQQIEQEILTFALQELLKQEPLLRSAHVNLEIEPAEFKCRRCGHEWILHGELGLELKEEIREAIHFIPEMAHVHLRCPSCGSPDFELIKGRGIWLMGLEGVK